MADADRAEHRFQQVETQKNIQQRFYRGLFESSHSERKIAGGENRRSRTAKDSTGRLEQFAEKTKGCICPEDVRRHVVQGDIGDHGNERERIEGKFPSGIEQAEADSGGAELT